jgi:hypothetical protein
MEFKLKPGDFFVITFENGVEARFHYIDVVALRSQLVRVGIDAPREIRVSRGPTRPYPRREPLP